MAAMIGDGGIDMHTGKTLDMICVGVLTGSGDADTLINAGADLVIDNVERFMGLDWI